jgi:hypothetical protein
MKPMAAALALGVLFAAAIAQLAQFAQAEEPPHLEFVQKLRQSHYPDLALEYLQKIGPTAPADLRPGIELELARARLDLALAETDASKRPTLLTQARQQFEAFVNNYPTSPEISAAKLELKELAVLQGRAQLRKAMRQSGSAKAAEARAARAALSDAAKQLEIGIKEIDLSLVKYDDAKDPKELKEKAKLLESKLKAELERGIILLEQIQTFSATPDGDAAAQRADIIKLARTALENTRKNADPHSPVHWQAQAWIAKCIHEDGDPQTARSQLEKIIKTAPATNNTPGLDAGKRLATYFLIQIVPEAAQTKADPNREQYDLAQTWLNAYSKDRETPEGCHVRFLLGEACINLAQSLSQDKNPKRAEIAQFYNQAKKLFGDLEQSENDFTERARSRRIQVVFTTSGSEKAAIKDLQTFDACFIRALFEAGQFEQDAKTIKDGTALEKKHKERNQNIVAALERGLKLAESARPKPPDADVTTATAMLVYSDLTSGKYKEAIELGEKLVRDKPLALDAPKVAMYTLQAYGQILSPEAKLSEDEEEEYRKKLEGLVGYVAQRWPNDDVSNLAHFQTGLLNIRDKKYPEAVEELSKVKDSFGAAIHAKYHLANTAFQVAKDRGDEKQKAAPADRDRLAKEELTYKERAVKALESLPLLPAGADAATNQIYIYGKVRLGQHLYTLKKYDEMEKLAEPLLKRLPEMRLPDESAREQSKSTLTLLLLYAAYGRADDAFKAGQMAKSRESLDKIVEQFKAGNLPELKKDPDLRGGILGLALRASFQEGKLDRAKEVLQVMQAAADNPQQANIQALLPSVAMLMKEEAARQKPDKAALEKTVAGFTAFLDELAKGQKESSPDFNRVLAKAYADLEQYAKVIEIASKIEAPKDDSDPRAVAIYRGARVLLMKAYRLSDKLDDADKLVNEAVKTWGKNNLDVQFERIHMFDAHKNYGKAATEWNSMTHQLLQRIKEPEIKPRYYEAFYHKVRSLHLYGKSKKEPKYIKQAVSLYITLESSANGFGPEESSARFKEFLSQEKEFKAEYDRQKQVGKNP